MKSELNVIHIKWQPEPTENLVASKPVQEGRTLVESLDQVNAFSLRRAYTPEKLRRMNRRKAALNLRLKAEA